MKTKSNEKILGWALAFSAGCHYGQFDQAGKPYFLHCLKVMELLKTDCIVRKVVALLHDAVEDKRTTWDELETVLSSEFIIPLKLLCKTKKSLSEDEEDQYFHGIETSEIAIDVKLADLTHNSDIRRLKGITQKDFDRVVKYQKRFYQLKNAKKNFKNV